MCANIVTKGAEMINYVVCDLFVSPALVLVNTVNTVGVMGKGIAREFKTIYPDMFGEYQKLCERKQFSTGDLWLYKTSNKWILNFPTKKHWRQPSRPEYIEEGLKKFVETFHRFGITSVSFPLLGCGNGELDWEIQVQPLMEHYLKPLPITVYIHLQGRKDLFEPEHRNSIAIQEWLRGEPESLAFSEVWRDLKSILADQITIQRLDKKETFTAVISGDGETLTLGIQGRQTEVPSEAFLDLWQQIRASGFVSGDSMPYGLDAYAGYIVGVMAQLPYVRPVAIATQYSKLNSRAVGLRLNARARPDELPLLAGVAAVEPE